MNDRGKRWLPRATTQFARTVHSELRRAGHDKQNILRFINELMDLMSGDPVVAAQAPALVDPEAGLPGADTMHDILEFELRIRPKDRRQDERLAVAAIDVVLPGWMSGVARQRTHEILYETISHGLRVGDSAGQLGPDRYLLVLPRSKEAVCASVQARIARALDQISELADDLVLECRWATAGVGGQECSSAIELLQQCFASAPTTLRATGGARNASAGAEPPAPSASGRIPKVERAIVLALGGGAARAVSHAGVLSVLDDAHIRPVAIAGCSAGGLVGAMIATGSTPTTIIAKFTEFSSTTLYREMRNAYATFLRTTQGTGGRSRTRYFGASNLAFYSDSALSALSGDHLSAFVEHFVGRDCDIARMPMPFSVVATDLVDGRPVKLSHGSLHAALTASCAVPGLFPPQRMGERLFVDGSTVTEVPIWAAHLFGVSVPILAVYMGRPFHRITDYRTSTEVSTRANALIHAELVREQLRRADLLLTIPMEDVGWLDFRKATRIVEIGRQAADTALPRIIARLDEHRAAQA